MQLTRRAFTLLELLVVVTIIAILAAILFPVFAQSKSAAKKAVATENLHQIALAVSLYSNDYSDQLPLDFASSSQAYFTWQDLLQPYSKSYGVMFDPLSQFQNTDVANSSDYWASFGMLPEASAVAYGQYATFTTRSSAWLKNFTPGGVQYDGVAGTSIDPFGWAGGNFNAVFGGVPSRDASSIARPGEYAYIFTSGNWDGWHGVYGYPSGFGYCGGWGQPLSYFGFQPRHSGGTDTCVIATRATDFAEGLAVVSFADGHVKSMGSQALLQTDPAGGNFLRYWWPNQ